MTKEYSDFLAHYGVKGQKKGVRRYQNEDGSYTQEGAERYWGGGHGRQPSQIPSTPSSSAARIGPPTAVRSRPTAIRTRQARSTRATQAEIDARKSRTRKILVVAGGTALAGIGAYLAYKHHKNNIRSNRMAIEMIGNARLENELNRGSIRQLRQNRDITRRQYRSMIRENNRDRRLINRAGRGKNLSLTQKLLDQNGSVTKWNLGKRTVTARDYSRVNTMDVLRKNASRYSRNYGKMPRRGRWR